MDSNVRTDIPRAGMKCPLCRIDLHIAERRGIEIDYCPNCRGVWLDRGELDKLMQLDEPPVRHPAASYPVPDRDPRSTRRDWDDDDGDNDRRGRKRGRFGGFLGDLFDFD